MLNVVNGRSQPPQRADVIPSGMRRTRQHAHAQTRTTCDGVSFKVNLRRTVASYSQRLISAREAFLPSPLVVRPCLVRTFSSEYPPGPVLVSRLADPRHGHLGRREVHTSRPSIVTPLPSSLPPVLSAMATDGSGAASPASFDSAGQFTPAQLAIIQEMITNATATETRTATGAHPVPPESHPGPSTLTGESG